MTDLYRGRLSYRRLSVLIKHLPLDSWTQTALRDAREHELLSPETGKEQKFGPWSLDNFQLARLTDAVKELTYVTAVAGQLTPRPEYPAPEPRPGLNRPVARQTSASVTYLNKLRARG